MPTDPTATTPDEEPIPPTPTGEAGFDPAWVEAVTRRHLAKKEEEKEGGEEGEVDPDRIRVTRVIRAVPNEVQGILSTTFVVDFVYEVLSGAKEDGEDAEEKKKRREASIFVKVPLKDEPQYESVNLREATMLRDVLPELKEFLDSKCEGFFKLPMPRLIHCHYDGSGVRDVFVLENLLADGYYNFSNECCLNREHLEAVLDSLAYLHGTGLAFRHSLGGQLSSLQAAFPGLESQLQLRDLVERADMREHFRGHLRAFLHFLEEEEPMLERHTGYMKKMHKHIHKIIETLENCGFESLITLAHGDAKPNNFLFRRIEIDLEGLECEGIEPILIDWQGGFVGSAANDLMWALFPFIEQRRDLLPVALEYYYDQLCNVLETFSLSPSDLQLPSSFVDFSSLLKRCLVLEFLIVTVVKPVMSVPKPEKLLRWHKETMKNRRRRFKRKVERPTPEEVFTSPRFTGFCSLYFRIATAVGAFQELGSIYFSVMRDSMFEDPNRRMDDRDSDEEAADTDLLSRIVNAPAADLLRAAAGAAVCAGVAAGVYLAVEHRVYERYLTGMIVPYCFQG